MTTRQPQEKSNSALINSFSKYARGYDKHARLQKQMAERLASFLPEKIPEQILEIGCGTGLFTQHLLAHPLKTLILNDIAPDMVERLQNKLTLPRSCQIRVGNAESMEFQQVGLIAANAVFQWFKSPSKTLKLLNSHLKPAGNLIFSTFGPATLAEFRQTASLESPASLLTLSQWKKLVNKAGFSLISSASETRKSFFPDTLALLKNLQQIGATPYRMTHSSDLRRLIKEYDENYSTQQGVYATWELLYFSAINKT